MNLPGGLELVVLPSGHQQIAVRDIRPVPPPPHASTGRMSWYLPYTKVHPQVVAAAPSNTVWVDVSPSPNSYYGALYAMWEIGESFAVLEHDVVCRPDVIDTFETCPEPWCIYGYSNMCHRSCMEAWRNALGCTRFRSELIAAVPDAMSSIPEDNWDWHEVCNGLGDNLRAAGYSHHWHEPWVDHHPWTDVHP